MTDLLTPDVVRGLLKGPLGYVTTEITVAHLCRDYLTLWDRNKELENEVRRMAGAVVESARNSNVHSEPLEHD